MFQFPSNGKGYLNLPKSETPKVGKIVSIPFKRERVSQFRTRNCLICQTPSFQFPSNGKGYLNPDKSRPDYFYKEFQFPSNGKGYLNNIYCKVKDKSSLTCFNSLQTGKGISIQWADEMEALGLTEVSIPFKRERVSQFGLCKCSARLKHVSIPFKRERVSQSMTTDVAQFKKAFQFPSNGKGYLNQAPIKMSAKVGAFQFPSNGKGYLNSGSAATWWRLSTSFNSLQTGKGISIYGVSFFSLVLPWFQFPSNGKGYLNERQRKSNFLFIFF